MAKQKVKTLKAAARRFKVTASGKIMHGHSYSRHIKASKSRSRIRKQKIQTEFEGAIKKRVQRMLPYSKA